MVALFFDSHGIEYEYEQAYLFESYQFRPDFTLRHPRTGEIVIYEHFGKIDDPDYYRKVIEKLMMYWMHGFRVGENLVFSVETKQHPLSPGDLEGIFRHAGLI